MKSALVLPQIHCSLRITFSFKKHCAHSLNSKSSSCLYTTLITSHSLTIAHFLPCDTLNLISNYQTRSSNFSTAIPTSTISKFQSMKTPLFSLMSLFQLSTFQSCSISLVTDRLYPPLAMLATFGQRLSVGMQ